MKKILLLVCALIVATTIMAKVDPVLKKALKYRTEISKEALKKVKKWEEKTGIIHNDWIENKYGKSIDFAGNELLPNVPYSSLKECRDSLFIVKTEGKVGVYARDGRMVIQPIYEDISDAKIFYNLFLCTKTGSVSTDKVTHVFTTGGKYVCSLFNAKDIYVSDVFGIPYNYVVIKYKIPTGEKVSELFYCDGETMCKEKLGDGRISVKSDTIFYSINDTTMCYPVINKKTNRPKLINTFSEAMTKEKESNNASFYDNAWVKLGMDYYGKGDYDKAQFCLNYYGKYESDGGPLRNITSMPNYMFYATLLDCYYNDHKYSDVIETVRLGGRQKSGSAMGIDVLYMKPYGLNYNLNTKKLTSKIKSSADLIINKDKADDIMKCLNIIVDTYNKSVTAYQQQQERNNILAAVLLGAVAGTTAALTGNNTQSTNKTTTTTNNSGYVAAPTTTTVSTPATTTSSSSSTRQATKQTCTRCSGSGKCIRCKGSGRETTFSGKSTTVCGMCNGGGSCLSCNGTGYHLRY